jgi:thiol-disulfide isomerase/thioredoxin
VDTTRRRSILVGLGIGALVTAGAVGVMAMEDDGDDRDVAELGVDPPDVSGDLVPATTLTTLDGRPVTLDQFRGRPLVVNFWQEACAPCRAEMPAFEQVHRQTRDRVSFIGINVGDAAEVTAKFVEDVGVTYDIVRDPSSSMVAPAKVVGLPTTLFVDASGRILESHLTELTAEELTAKIDEHFS